MLQIRGGALRRVEIRSHKSSPAGVLELVMGQLSWRGVVLPLKPPPQKKQKTKFGSPYLPAGPPAQSNCGGSGGRGHRRRWPRGFLARAFSRSGVSAPK